MNETNMAVSLSILVGLEIGDFWKQE